MIDWSESMLQRFEYYIVDPMTWRDKKRLYGISSCTINRDLETDTLGSATLTGSEIITDDYIRVYMIVEQNNYSERIPMGTFLVQSPEFSFDGKRKTNEMNAYTPLIELKENQPPIGYFIRKGNSIIENVVKVADAHMRGPVIKAVGTGYLEFDFVANSDDTWLSFCKDLLQLEESCFGLDDIGQVVIVPKQDITSLQPIWTYDTKKDSIIYDDIRYTQDLFNIPNTVEVIYSGEMLNYVSVCQNDDENSPVSIQRRGREIVKRILNPSFPGKPSKEMIDQYARNVLRDLSKVKASISYRHGYCPVRIGDCVRIDYPQADIRGVKAKVISQSIACEPGCVVKEEAIFTVELWR